MFGWVGQIAIGGLLIVGAPVVSVWACTESWLTFFDFESDSVSPQALATIDAFSKRFGKGSSSLSPQCLRVKVTGHNDRAEGEISGDTFGLQRGNAIRDALVARGIASGSIEVRTAGPRAPMVPTASGTKEPQNRRVELTWGYGNGRWRCDPAVERPYATTCGRDLRSCYFELADGTVCNFHDVADPTRAKYTVDPEGEKLE
jgi:hypothetical protein